MTMTVDELRPIRKSYAIQGGQNRQIDGLTLWQSYFLLYVALRQVRSMDAFQLPDTWLTEINTTNIISPSAAYALQTHLDVQSVMNPAACAVAGLTEEGKAFLKRNLLALSDAIAAFGMTEQDIDSL